jgi:predicted phosphodiesterase
MTTRVAIMTDIHGNAPALRTALADVDAAGDIARIHVLGDMVSIGPDTAEVLDLLFARPDLDLITGNHEEYVLALSRGHDPHLQGEELERLLLVHYHADPAQRLAPVEWKPTLESLETRYGDTPFDAVCFGHHHPVHLFRSDRRLYLNPGALGCSDRPVARYGILTITSETIDVTLREVPYHNRDFLASYDRLQVPARSFIRKIFHGDQFSSE